MAAPKLQIAPFALASFISCQIKYSQSISHEQIHLQQASAPPQRTSSQSRKPLFTQGYTVSAKKHGGKKYIHVRKTFRSSPQKQPPNRRRCTTLNESTLCRSYDFLSNLKNNSHTRLDCRYTNADIQDSIADIRTLIIYYSLHKIKHGCMYVHNQMNTPPQFYSLHADKLKPLGRYLAVRARGRRTWIYM